MLLQDLKTKLENLDRGKFTHIEYKSEKVVNGDIYTKETSGVVRFVCYGNISGVQVKGKVNPNEQVIIPNILYYNTKTQNYLLQVATTEVKPLVKYYLNGKETDRATYELGVKPRQNSFDSVVFRVNVNNVIALSQK